MSSTKSVPSSSSRAMAVWLLLCCAMILLMVVIGGVTRLTESGLSITEWKPITGILPPLSEGAWREEFTKYQAIPQYRDIHSSMDLAAFKTIYYWEYVHRLWGRLIGAVFAVPFLWFLLRGRIDRRLGLKLGGLFLLGGAQGALGWYMVASGLADRDFVSQYRLAAHLGFAAVIYVATLWVALDLLRGERGKAAAGMAKSGVARHGASLVIAMVLVTLVAGGFVAGLHAGLIYNTFPLMNGQLVPDEYWQLVPGWRNWFENVAAVQFNHRALAIATLGVVILVWLLSRRERMMGPRARLLLNLLLAAGLVQVGLGIATLLLFVPIPLAAAHQAGAMLLLTAAVAARHALSRPQE